MSFQPNSLVLSLFAVLLAGGPHAASDGYRQKPPLNPSLVRVFVQTDDDGVPEELKARQESVKDLASVLADRKKSIAVVETEEAADVVVEVIGRSVSVPRVVVGIGARPGQPPGVVGPVRTAVLRVRLTFGEEALDLTNKNKPSESGGGWKSAADDIGTQIDKWVSARRAEIIRHRGGERSWRPTG